MSTSAVDTWRNVKIWTENLTEVLNEFLPIIHVPLMIQNKTEVLNLKTRKIQVPIRYLTFFFFFNLKQILEWKRINQYHRFHFFFDIKFCLKTVFMFLVFGAFGNYLFEKKKNPCFLSTKNCTQT
jgi:hypothetical protein